MVANSKKIICLLFLVFLFGNTSSVNAQAVQIPNCKLFPKHPFCLPEPKAKPDPIVFVPGLVASYNRRVLFKDKPGGTWTFVPFGNIYAGLLARIQSKGYVKNKDLYIAFYDWRHSNKQSAAEYLAPIIAKAIEHSERGKVDIVAHSMGGLLTQEYIASDKYTEGEIDQFIMLGTPNAGSSDAYLPWEGGILPPKWNGPTRLYIKSIESALKKTRNFNSIAPLTYRQFFPSLKELLPTGTFVTKSGEDVPRDDLTEQNPFLAALGDYRDALLNDTGITVTTIAGTEKETLHTIALKNDRTDEDISLERWRDGHPIQEIPQPNANEGDQTVLASSALFGNHTITLPGVSHTALPEYAQNDVLKALGVADNKPKQFIYKEPKWLTGFVVLSPVDIAITDASGKTVSKDTNNFGEDAFVDISEDEDADDPKIIILQNLPPGTYTVHLTGTGTGEYTVITTHTNDTTSESETLTGNTTPGKEELFTVTIEENGDDMDVSDITDDSPEPDPTPAPTIQGGGDEKDCCPGKDPEPVVSKKKVVKKGKVLGTTKRAPVTLEELKPLNDVFFSVYGRLPTYDEWKYWAMRYSKDKRDWVQIRGAMSWWKARGSHPL